MSRWSVFVPKNGVTPFIDNTRHLARILYRWRSYRGLVGLMLGRVPFTSILRTQYPYLLPDSPVPPSVTVEFTNLCNVSCTYCTSPLALRPQGMMAEATFARLLEQLRLAGAKRVRLVGNGEATLHPQFAEFARRLASTVPFVSLVTNAQRVTDRVLDGILDAPIRYVEVSVDGGDAEAYERSRIHGRFDRLLVNLRRLKAERDRRRSPTRINLRLMVRPSQATEEAALEAFWRPYTDSLMKQYVIKRRELDLDPDVYQNVQRVSGDFPRCTLPFKELDVMWSGDVPLCHYSAAQIGEPGLLLGNINESTLTDLWRSPTMVQYRSAHRSRDAQQMPVCSGCSAV